MRLHLRGFCFPKLRAHKEYDAFTKQQTGLQVYITNLVTH